MGRGRAKAKQQKVARELKYGGPDTDLDRLAAELSADRSSRPDPVEFADEESEEDKYAEWISGDDEDDAEDEDDTERR